MTFNTAGGVTEFGKKQEDDKILWLSAKTLHILGAPNDLVDV